MLILNFYTAPPHACQQTDSPSLLARLLVMTTQDASIFSSDDVLLTAALLDSIIVSVPDVSMEQVSAKSFSFTLMYCILNFSIVGFLSVLLFSVVNMDQSI